MKSEKNKVSDIFISEAIGKFLNQIITELTHNLHALLSLHHEISASWVKDATDYGETIKEKHLYTLNTKQQVSLWGRPNVKDYAFKAWQAMYADYYLPRWFLYLNKLKSAGKPFTHVEEGIAQQDLIAFGKTMGCKL